MKVKFGKETLDVNSTEMKDLVIGGRIVGQYSYGLYSQLVDHIQKRDRELIAGELDTYAVNLLEKEPGIGEIKSKEDLFSAINSLDCSFTEWLEEKIKEDLSR